QPATIKALADHPIPSSTGHPRHWPRNSLFDTVFDPLHVILSPLGSTSHNGVASRRAGLVAGGISVPSSLCCRWTGQVANTSQASTGRCVLGCFEDQHQTHTSPRVSQAAVHQGNQPLKTVSWRWLVAYLKHNGGMDMQELFMWSDGCAGQFMSWIRH
ncbi:hypothetical protein HaLaN_17760, partial [Haematococcus lacustris]